MGGLGALTGADGDDKLRLDRKRARRVMLGEPGDRPEGNKHGAFGAKLEADKDNLELFRSKFEGILGNIGAYGRSAKQDASAAYANNLSDTTQRAISTGRYSTSMHDSARQQAGGMFARSIADINSSLASTYSNVAMQGLNTEIGLNTAVGYNEFDRGMFASENWWPSGTNYQPQTGGLMNLMGNIQGGIETGAAVAGAAGSIGGFAAGLSDRRLKRNIVPAGRRNGHAWYTWDWVWGGSSEGVIADEVERYMPEAIGDLHGFKTVDYGML